MFRKLARFGDLRLKTSSCWRKTRPRLHVGRTSNSERSTSRSRISNAIIACGGEFLIFCAYQQFATHS